MRSTHRAGRRSSYRHSLGHRPVRNRSAFTLLEVMIATAVTLLMMISLVQVFKVIGDSMKQGRAALQMNNSLRSVTTRLRQDLGNLTVRVDPPSDASSGGGYFEYFDGSMTDYTAALFAGDTPKSNRFGDTDDILMFTARAGSSWFTGQVPECIVDSTKPFDPNNPNPVVITSQLAEIAVFARPVTSLTTGAFDDVAETPSNGFPDSFRLHYRVLLIRPDLNTSVTTSGTTTFRSLEKMTISSGTDEPTTMADFFGFCDLSMHRIDNGGTDLIAANSLEDLANPANRFAHYQYSLAGAGTGGSCTMPLLVLDPISNAALTVTADPNPAAWPTQLRGVGGNYLSSAYVLDGDRQGEDVIANNVLAFDVKGFDPGAPIIATVGEDGRFGIKTSATTWSGIQGQDGSDDLILSPNDPGYLAAYNVPAANKPPEVSYGEYVDLMWGSKALRSLTGYSLNYSDVSHNSPLLSTALSGLDAAGDPSNSLKRSGKALTVLNTQILQPTYDTWTTAYESNGTKQRPIAQGNGTIDINAWFRRTGSGSQDNAVNIDAGTDGLDTPDPFTSVASGGVDDASELETLPPFPIKLRGIKVSVRIEDLNTRQIKQMSVASEFATQ